MVIMVNSMKKIGLEMQKIKSKRALTAWHPIALRSKLWRLGALALLWLLIFGSSLLPAQMVTNNPVEATYAFGNPLMGFRPGLNDYNKYPYRTVIRQYIRWNQIENNTNDTVQKIKDYCDSQWASLPANNIKVIPRVYLDWDSSTNNEYWPADLQTGDWTSQAFKDRVVRLIGRLGEVWDNDPRVAWIQTGIIGYWGEQENPVGVSQDGWAQRMGDAYTNAFKNKKLVVRNLEQWPGYEMGSYWDSFAHPAQNGVRNTINSYNSQGRYLTQVMEGEVAYGWGTNVAIPAFGAEPEITLNQTNYTDYIIDAIRELHASALGWVGEYELDGRFGTDTNNIKMNAARMQKEFGYRFHITEFACSARTEPGANMDVRFKVKNKGSAPFYENWPVAVVLINETNRQIVWKATLPNVDIRTWRPGDNYDTNSRVYLTPAQEYLHSASVQLPASLATGQYLIGLSILEPLSRTPGIFFAVTNFFKQSQSQPLMRIGIGANASSHILTGVAFDNLENDDTRYYTMTAQGPTNTLIALPSTNGSVSLNPGGGIYLKDTGVEVTANGVLGYAFGSWGGALAGLSNNPAIIAVETSKTISANYVAVPTYTLTASAANGSITLNPPGGVYNAGTLVTAKAIPNRGYAFTNWSGALTGSTNPATITMNGNNSVTANFVALSGDIAPWTESFALANGAMMDGPPTAWTATRSSGLFQVSGNRLMINGAGVEGVFETAEISISGGSVKVSLEVQSQGVDSADYMRFYKIVDGGAKVLINQQMGAGTNTMVGTGITGSKLKLRIETKVSFGDEYYYFDNLKVEDESLPPTYTLTTSAPNGAITLNPPGGVYATGTVVTVTANPNYGYALSNWSGAFSGSVNPTNLTMNANQSVTANFGLIPFYTVTTSATNGAISLNPPGGVYTNGTVVTVTAIPNSGYGFGNWSGDLSGSVNPTTIAMNGNKSLTANFGVAFGEPLPWLVNFNGLATGTTNQGWPASWTATRGGTFRVNGDRLEINGAGGEGVFTSGVINISGGAVNVSVGVQGGGGLDSGDYMRFYIKTNGGAERLIRQVSGAQAATTWTTNGITGTNLQVVIRASVTAADEFYYLDNISITNIAPINPTVSITQPANGAVVAAGANLLMTASASDPDGSVVRVDYFVAGTTKIGQSTNAPTFSFTWTNVPAGRYDLSAMATDNVGATGVSAAVPLTIRTWLQSSPQPGGQIQIQWAGGGTLQTASNVVGPWSDVSGVVSPYLHATTNSAQFFRVKQ